MLVPFGIALALRLALRGGPPFTDEGTYQFNAWLAREVGGSLPVAPLNGYAWFASLVGGDVDAPFHRVRVFDAFVGAFAAAAFAWMLRRFSEKFTACALASLWAALAAAPLVNDAGFKNSIAAAWIPTFVAIGLLARRDSRGSLRAGTCVAFAVMMREAFLPAALLVPLVALARRGRAGALRCILGGAVGGAIVFAWMFAAGISPLEAIDNLRAMSRNASELLRITGGDPSAIRWDYFGWMVDFCGFLAWPAVVGLATVPLWRARRWKLAAPVLALFALPLPEIFGKFCLPYHWFQLAPALLLLGAIGWRRLGARWRFVPIGTWVVFGVCVAFGRERALGDVRSGLALSDEFRGVMIDGDWTSPAIARSRYLEVAAWIRDHTDEGATVAVSGYAYGIYQLAKRRPASAFVSDLTLARMTGMAERNAGWFDALRANPPDVVIETLRWKEPLDAVWPDFEERYELAREWPKEGVHYGWFPMRAWVRAR